MRWRDEKGTISIKRKYRFAATREKTILPSFSFYLQMLTTFVLISLNRTLLNRTQFQSRIGKSLLFSSHFELLDSIDISNNASYCNEVSKRFSISFYSSSRRIMNSPPQRNKDSPYIAILICFSSIIEGRFISLKKNSL